MADTTERIKIDMTPQDMIFALAKGVPGAITVAVGLVARADNGFMDLLMLDTLGIYESDIWMLYKDVCAQNLDDMHACIQATRLGGLADCTPAKLKFAIQNRGKGINVSAVRTAVDAHYST